MLHLDKKDKDFMPELPEVETVRRGLDRLVVGKTIGQVRVRYAR